MGILCPSRIGCRIEEAVGLHFENGKVRFLASASSTGLGVRPVDGNKLWKLQGKVVGQWKPHKVKFYAIRLQK